MAAVFALASAASDPAAAPPEAVTGGMQVTFLGAALIIIAALAVAVTNVRMLRYARRKDCRSARQASCHQRSARLGQIGLGVGAALNC